MSSESSNDWNPEKASNGVSALKGKKKVITKSISSYMTSKNHDKSDIENGLEDYVPLEKNITPKKTLSVEKIYQKKTQLEHILLRPDTYIGSVEPLTQGMWVYNGQQGLEYRDITYVPGLFKIFDEILVNAADNKIRDKTMNCIKVTIQPENNLISIWNNGKGIPVIEHKTEKIYIPALIFGHLLTSSNFDDSEKKVTGGRNGYGAKLCNIFSKKFSVETACKEYGKKFKQTWTDNMTKTTPPHITSYSGSDFTCITFEPDLQKFKMTELDKDIVDLFCKRAYDIAASTWGGVKVFLNDTKLPINTFKDYIDLYIKDKVDENDEPLKLAYEKAGERWEVGITNSDKGFQSVSFVNSICTVKGGRHVDYIADQIITKLLDSVKKKNKAGINIKPFQVRNHIWIFVNCLVENPTFDSQTKESMTLQPKSFGSKCVLSDKFMTSVSKTGIVESIMNWIQFKAQSQLNTKCHAKKHSKLKGIPKLDDANDAGTKNSLECTLILTEGDSAKTLAVSGLGIVGRDRYGVFPLRGKLLNVREATHKQLLENAEINNVIRILGLQYKKQYTTLEDLKTLRYGKIMIMADQDQDGSHIKGLIINFIHYNWPSLIKQPFVDQFITPIVKAFKGKEEVSFFSLPEFEEWKSQTQNWNTWRVKYYKGLGTSTSKEAKDYFSNMSLHRIKFRYDGNNDDDAILLAFSKKKIEDRKDWLKTWMESRRERKLNGLPEIFLYQKNSHQLTYHEFINKELVLFSNMDNERSIPSLCDGLKPGQRKVLFTCFKRNDKREIKVAQLAGSVGELSAYHHGEASLMGTIINLAQNFVGSNNLNLLLPIGQFGTRLHGGKDAASPRYIFTLLSPLARAIFHPMDDAILNYLYDDNIKIEPEWYIPIIPMVLVNGAEGIGTGWSTKVPNYDPREIIQNLKAMLHTTQINGRDGACPEPFHMIPKFKGFRGQLLEADEERIATYGEIAILSDVGECGDYEGSKDTVELEITELPIKRWTQDYKENVLEPMLNGTEKVTPAILDYKEYNTDSTVRFVVKMGREKYREAQKEGLHRFFKLQNALSTSSMVLFDSAGVINRYKSEMDILKDFYMVRLKCYQKRKDYLDGLLTAEALKLNNQARFILEKIKGTIVIENKKKADLIARLVEMKFDSDPLKKWKQKVDKDRPEENVDNEDENEKETSGGPSYDYLLGLPLWSLTKERVDDLLEKQKLKNDELELLRKTSIEKLWLDDLDNLLKEMDKLDAKEAEELKEGLTQGKQTATTAKGKLGKRTSGLQKLKAETLPSKYATRIVPEVDAILKLKIEKAKESKEKKRAGNSAKAKSESEAPLTSDNVKNESVESAIEVFDEIKSSESNPDVMLVTNGDHDDVTDANGVNKQKNGLKTKPKTERKVNVKKLKQEKKPQSTKSGRSNKVLDSSESASENDFRPSNDEESVDRASPLPLRARLGRTCIPKKFDFSDSEDEA